MFDLTKFLFIYSKLIKKVVSFDLNYFAYFQLKVHIYDLNRKDF